MGIAQRFIFKRAPSKAIKEHLKLIEASPGDKRLHLKLGDLYLKNGENDKAIKEYLQVADLFTEEDLNSRAISIYKKVLSIDPNLVEACHRIARLYLKEGLVGSARNYYHAILKIRPDDQEALKGLETLQEQQSGEQEPPSAPRPPLSPSVKDSPSGPTVTQTQSPETGNDLPLPGARDPGVSSPFGPRTPDKDSEMHYHLGIAYKEMDLLDYAISEFEQAANDPALVTDCHIMLGESHMAKGDYDQSIRYYRMAVEAEDVPNGKRARLHFSLGLAYEANGMFEEAIEAFRIGSSLDQSFLEAKEKVKQLQGMGK
jgi:tetratricopeptide (TPR) repeat protein